MTSAEEIIASLQSKNPDFLRSTESWDEVLRLKNPEVMDWFLENMTFSYIAAIRHVSEDLWKVPGMGRVLRKQRLAGRFAFENLSEQHIGQTIKQAATVQDQIELIEDLLEMFGPEGKIAPTGGGNLMEYELSALRIVMPHFSSVCVGMTEGIIMRGDCMDLLKYCPREYASVYTDNAAEMAIRRYPENEREIVRAFFDWSGGGDVCDLVK